MQSLTGVGDTSMSAPPNSHEVTAASIHDALHLMGHQIEGQLDEFGSGSVGHLRSPLHFLSYTLSGSSQSCFPMGTSTAARWTTDCFAVMACTHLQTGTFKVAFLQMVFCRAVAAILGAMQRVTRACLARARCTAAELCVFLLVTASVAFGKMASLNRGHSFPLFEIVVSPVIT